MAAAIGLQIARDRLYQHRERETERILYVRSGATAKRLSLDFDALAADAYWIRAIQHYGGDRLFGNRVRKYELLYPLLELTTTLDPYFTIAYRFGAIFLSEGCSRRPGPSRSRRSRCCRRGSSAQPRKWQYSHDIAFVHYWHLRDYKTAAEWFQRAADQPSAPNWLRPLAAGMLTRRERPRLFAAAVESDSPVGAGGMAAVDGDAQPAAARRARSDRSAAADRAAVSASSWHAVLVGRFRAARDPSRHTARSGRDAVRARSRDRHRVRLAGVSAFPDAGSLGRHESRHARARGPGHPRPRDRQLPQRLHPSTAAAGVDRQPRVELSAVRLRAAVDRQHPGRQLRDARRPLPAVPRADLAPLPDRRARDHGDLRRSLCRVRRGRHPRAAAAVRQHADRALRDRPRAPPAAERHHATGDSRRARVQRPAAAGDRRRAHRHRCWAAASCGSSARRIIATRARREWAAATSRCSP